jgi:hypothetical protein
LAASIALFRSAELQKSGVAEVSEVVTQSSGLSQTQSLSVMSGIVRSLVIDVTGGVLKSRTLHLSGSLDLTVAF